MDMGRLRVIAGLAKGRRLHMVPGVSTRPIIDRVKESLFNILGPEISGSNFLDLFAGTGSVGIEALSRGAAFVRFLDLNKNAFNTIKKNLEITDFLNKSEVIQVDAYKHISRKPDIHFDYVYVAPPQYKGMWEKSLDYIDKQPDWLVSDGWVVVQIDPKEYQKLEMKNFSEFDQRKYGNTLLVFFEREPEA